MDPTSLTQLSNRYNSISAYLLHSSDLLHQHDPRLLECFKEIYGTSGYLCRYQCKRRINGFVSIEERDQHEAYYHIKVYRCGEVSCDLSLRGFPTKAALQHHITVHHGKATDKPAPILRRKIGMHLKKVALEKEAALAKEAALERQAALAKEAALERQAALAKEAAAIKEDSEIAGHRMKSGPDWNASFNPKLDIDLLHHLPHPDVVCCIKFSHDGKYVATGSNRLALIFDVATGFETCILQEETKYSFGSLYIRCVCFSPDGNYLATGAEDNRIRVSNQIDIYVLLLTSLALGYRF
jgi:hypothetical protein